MKIGFFPGCSLHGTALEYDESLKAVCKEFDIELVEINDWNCCGATAAHSLNRMLSLALPSRNLALAERQSFDEILVPCAACYSRLLTAWHEFKADEKVRNRIPDIIEMPLEGRSKPINIIEFIEKYISKNLKEKVKQDFNKKVACYYGCLLVRPKELVQYERYEDPTSMDDIMKLIGAKTIDWAFKTECCGAGLSVSRTDVVGKLSGKIINDADHRGAEAIIAACPMCQSNLDMRRPAADSYLNRHSSTPVLYITQAIGLALGIDEKKLGLQKHFVPATDLLKPVAANENNGKEA